MPNMRVAAVTTKLWPWLTAGLVAFYVVYLIAGWTWLGRFGDTPSLVLLPIVMPGAAAWLASKIDSD